MAPDLDNGGHRPTGFASVPKHLQALIRRPSDAPGSFNALALAFDHVSDGIIVADMRQRGQPIVQVNAAFERITGYPAAEATGKNCRYLQGSDRLQPELEEIRAALAEGRACAVTLRNYRRDGTMFRNALRLEPLHDAGGKLTHFVGILRDVTLAPGIDRLTGMLDRDGLLDRLTGVKMAAGAWWMVLKLDLQRFHDINNGFGYDVGDAVLQAMTGRLATLSASAVARVGGNTFVLVFQLREAEEGAAKVDEVLAVLARVSFYPACHWR